MFTKRCPHLVRHGQVGRNDSIEFTNICALKRQEKECCLLPENELKNFLKCINYRTIFQGQGDKNKVRLNENSDLETRLGDQKFMSDMDFL